MRAWPGVDLAPARRRALRARPEDAGRAPGPLPRVPRVRGRGGRDDADAPRDAARAARAAALASARPAARALDAPAEPDGGERGGDRARRGRDPQPPALRDRRPGPARPPRAV